MLDLYTLVADVPDYPEPGIVFKDSLGVEIEAGHTSLPKPTGQPEGRAPNHLVVVSPRGIGSKNRRPEGLIQKIRAESHPPHGFGGGKFFRVLTA